jgi:hypothetical protein
MREFFIIIVGKWRFNAKYLATSLCIKAWERENTLWSSLALHAVYYICLEL